MLHLVRSRPTAALPWRLGRQRPGGKAGEGERQARRSFHGQAQGEWPAHGRSIAPNVWLQPNVLVRKSRPWAEPDLTYRLMVGPDLLASNEQPPADLVDQLTTAGAISQDVFPRANQERIRLALSRFTWFCWWKTCIVVHGTVRKLLNPGEAPPVYAPICDGTVQIFQVDLGCTLDRLDSFRVLLLRDLLTEKLRGLTIATERLDRLRVSADFGPRAQARSIGEATARLVQSSAVAGRAEARAEVAMGQVARMGPTAVGGTPVVSSAAEAAITLASLPAHLVKQFVVANKPILWLHLCQLIPDWAFCWQALGEVPIQSEGTFWAEICFWCPDDFPDLYFEVVQNINGAQREIYDPPIACSTYYDYDGSRSVDIVIDDPLAVACVPYPHRPVSGVYVWPTAIGNLDLNVITDLEGIPTVSTALTGSGFGKNPWAGTLALQMSFDPAILSTSVRYYRWSYRFDGDADFTQINESVTHRYRQAISFSPLSFVYQPFVLGPNTVNATHNLYHVIPDLDPSPGGFGWVDVNDPLDRPFGYFDSTGNLLPPFTNRDDALPRRTGLCTLLLELFDGSGNLVPCSNLGLPGPFVFVLPDPLNPAAYTSSLTANNVTPQGQLSFRVRVDNEDTVAELPGVHVGAASADGCGLLHVGTLSDLVSVDYVATHPHNFLSWDLSIIRGTCTVTSFGGGIQTLPHLPRTQTRHPCYSPRRAAVPTA